MLTLHATKENYKKQKSNTICKNNKRHLGFNNNHVERNKKKKNNKKDT